MWRAEFDDLCLEQAQENEQAGVPLNATRLQGLKTYINVNQQILCNPVIFQQVWLCAHRAWDHISAQVPLKD
jgi:hypothetical protein